MAANTPQARPGTSPSAPSSSQHSLSFIWKASCLGVSLDLILKNGTRSPLTIFYMWPESDSWELLKAELERRQLDQKEKVMLLNTLTRVINLWQSTEVPPNVREARKAFPNSVFSD